MLGWKELAAAAEEAKRMAEAKALEDHAEELRRKAGLNPFVVGQD